MITREQITKGRLALDELRAALIAAIAAEPLHADKQAAEATRDNIDVVKKGLRYLLAGVELSTAQAQVTAAQAVVTTMTQNRADGYQ